MADPWTDEDLQKIRRALTEHRLTRGDLYFWTEVHLRRRACFDLGKEVWLTEKQVEDRAEMARMAIESTLGRPVQEAYLGRWL